MGCEMCHISMFCDREKESELFEYYYPSLESYIATAFPEISEQKRRGLKSVILYLWWTRAGAHALSGAKEDYDILKVDWEGCGMSLRKPT